MKKFSIPIILLVLCYILNIFSIVWLILELENLTLLIMLLNLPAIILVTLTLFSLGDLYNWMMLVENRKLRLGLVIGFRTLFLLASIVGVVGNSYLAYRVFYLVHVQTISSLFGLIYTDALLTLYFFLGLFSLIFLRRYRTSEDNLYRLQILASQSIFDKRMTDIESFLEDYALGITDDQCIVYFDEVVKKAAYPNRDEEYYKIMTGRLAIILHSSMFGTTLAGKSLRNYFVKEHLEAVKRPKKHINDYNVIAKPFAILFPDQITIFRQYAANEYHGKLQHVANDLVNAIEYQIQEISTSDISYTKIVESLKPIVEDIKRMRAVIQDTKEVNIETLIKSTNMTEEQIRKISPYIDRDYHEGKLLSKTKFLAILTRLV